MYGSDTQTGAGAAIADYRMYIPALDEEGAEIGFGKYPKEYENYLDLSGYETLFIDLDSVSSQKKNVEYAVIGSITAANCRNCTIMRAKAANGRR